MFTLAVNGLRLFTIKFSRGKEEGVCLVSKPQRTFHKYNVYSIILSDYVLRYSGYCSNINDYINILYHIYTIPTETCTCHATASGTEKKSCILIVCVMIVFCLAGVPRLYFNLTLFSTYEFNLDTLNISNLSMQNVAIQKLTTEFHQLYSAFLDASLSHISGGAMPL